MSHPFFSFVLLAYKSVKYDLLVSTENASKSEK